jgi:hypothetical protein
MPDRRGRAAVACALLVAGCTVGSTEPAVVPWTATLLPLEGTGPTASLAALTEGGNTRLSVVLRDGEPESVYGWRIRTGGCSASGPGHLGGLGTYPDLVTDVVGDASAGGTLAKRLLVREPYHAVILDAEDETRTLACGSLQRAVS